MNVKLSINQESFPLAKEFRISRGAKTQADVILVKVYANGHTGYGESVPYARYDETTLTVTQQLEALTSIKELNLLKQACSALPAGSARNALDCALWDLAVQVENKSIQKLISVPVSSGCITAQTLSIDTPENMFEEALTLEGSPLIKVKLDDQQIVERMQAIHRALPQSKFIVDANEGWQFSKMTEVLPILKTLNVVLIEQPLPAHKDDQLLGYKSPISLCADESCHTAHNIDELAQKYQAINIKLDKTGGLTEALKLLKAARQRNLEIMVGCMVGTSLAMAPAYSLCSYADFVDLDGPLLVAKDRENGFDFIDGWMSKPESFLWGEPRV